MIKIGTVTAVHTVSEKTIVSVALAGPVGHLRLMGATVAFASEDPVAVIGCKMWPDRREGDLLCGPLPSLPTVGAPVRLVRPLPDTAPVK